MIVDGVLEAIWAPFQDAAESILIIRQTLRPLRLTKWQMAKLLGGQVLREVSPTILFLVGVAVSFLGYSLWRLLFRKKPEDQLGLPVVGGSKGHKRDFKEVIEEGARKVSRRTRYLETTKLTCS